MRIRLNHAWDDIPMEFVDDVLEYLQARLQPTHPLKGRKLFPVARRDRRDKLLLEDDDDGQSVWILDFEAKRRIKGRMCFDCRQLQTQEDFDKMMSEEYEDWVQQMKDAGAWDE